MIKTQVESQLPPSIYNTLSFLRFLIGLLCKAQIHYYRVILISFGDFLLQKKPRN